VIGIESQYQCEAYAAHCLLTRVRRKEQARMALSQLSVRKGFTLIELLVILAILGVLVGLLLPAVQRIREAANRVRCLNNLKQIGIALHNHHDSLGSFPSGYLCRVQPQPANTAPGWGWAAQLLPYVEQDNLFGQARLDLPIEHPSQLTVRT